MQHPALKAPQLLEALRWRYAAKVFDPSAKIPADIWSALEETLILTPSSYGLQPWKFVVITNPDIKEKLVGHSWGQKQVRDCSHLVVFLVKRGVNVSDVDRWIGRMAEVNGVSRESLNGYRDFMMGDFVNGPRKAIVDEWATRQVYIALGNFMTSAAMLGVDTCPMEGIDPGKYDEVLDLKSSGYATVVACAAGHRSAQDKYASAPKVRYTAAELIERR